MIEWEKHMLLLGRRRVREDMYDRSRYSGSRSHIMLRLTRNLVRQHVE